MDRRKLLSSLGGGALVASSGCLSGFGESNSERACGDCTFERLIISAIRKEPIQVTVRVERNGEQVLERELLIPETELETKQAVGRDLIDEINQKNGSFVVFVSTPEDTVETEVTKNTSSKTYGVSFEISDAGVITPYLPQQRET